MNTDKDNQKLDELISGAIRRERPQFDLDKWKQQHREQIEVFRAQKESASAVLEPNFRRITLWRRVGYLAAALLVVASWVACFVLSEEVAHLRNELELARQDVPLARPDDTTTINLYLQEHRDVVARHVSFSPAAPQPVQMRVSPHDVIYYEIPDDEPEYMHPGIIVIGPPSQREISPPEAPAISNGHTLTLSEARQAAGFNLVSPSWLDPGYALDQIRRIEGRDALQLLYTDGINSVSLFEQSLDGQRGLEAKDFREYAVYRNKGQAGGTILAWRDDTLSYVLIGNAEMSQLMNMAQSISAAR